MSCVVPVPLFCLYTAKMLEHAVCGKEQVDLAMLKKVVRYENQSIQRGVDIVRIILYLKVQKWYLREPGCCEMAVANTGIFLQRREDSLSAVCLGTLQTTSQNQRHSAEVSNLRLRTCKAIMRRFNLETNIFLHCFVYCRVGIVFPRLRLASSSCPFPTTPPRKCSATGSGMPSETAGA